MAGTKAGGAKASQTIRERDPDYYRRIGQAGGKAKVPKGFAISGKASEAGRKGGLVARRSTEKRFILWE
jgi:uncharacterized protein